jgi:hypothetical protein
MTVHCEGDCRIIEQTGEKPDFESELRRLGFEHQHFMLYMGMVPSEMWPQMHHNYSVTVANVETGQQRVYHGGPGHDWVRECACDLASGVFGRAPS